MLQMQAAVAPVLASAQPLAQLGLQSTAAAAAQNPHYALAAQALAAQQAQQQAVAQQVHPVSQAASTSQNETNYGLAAAAAAANYNNLLGMETQHSEFACGRDNSRTKRDGGKLSTDKMISTKF